MNIITCNHCGEELSEGSLRYVVDIAIFADYDGSIDEEPEGNIEDKIKQILESMEGMDPKRLEDDIYQEISFILCKPCRDRLKKSLIPYANLYDEGERRKGIIH